MRFDNHIAMVMEKGIINMDQYLSENVSELTTMDYPKIISSVFNIVKEAHRKKLVLLDLKGSNVMLFDSGPGMTVWKGIDLDGSLLVGKLLDDSSFMATVPFMAPELLAVDSLTGLRADPLQDIWSLGILTFNILVANQIFTFWTLLGIYDDTEIKEEIRSGKFTQERVDELISRTFPGNANSNKKKLLLRMLKIFPTARSTIAALDSSPYFTGVASFSTSTLFNNQQHIMGNQQKIMGTLKSLHSQIEDGMAAIVECIPDNLEETLAAIERSTSSADKKRATELREKQVIESSHPTVQYYVTMQVSMNSVLNACTVISSDMVANNRKGLAGTIAAAIDTFASVANPIPFAKFGLDILKGALNKWDERQQRVAVNRVMKIFLGDSTVSSMVAEGVARRMALYRKSQLEEDEAKSQQQRKGPAFAKAKEALRYAVDMCLNQGEGDHSKFKATADTQTILQALLDGVLEIDVGTSTTAAEKAEKITTDIITYIQS
jgi:serine/threonine protein kinase